MIIFKYSWRKPTSTKVSYIKRIVVKDMRSVFEFYELT